MGYPEFIITMLGLIILVICGLQYAADRKEADDDLDHEIDLMDEQISLLKKRAKHINLRI